MAHDVRRAVVARDAATARLRRVTAGVTAACVGSTVLFAGLAAGSTHLRKVVPPRRPAARSARPKQPVRAPVPPLVAVAAPSPAPAQPPAPAPAPAAQAPVVVSGGS